MKNFLLSLFGLACLGTASADTYMHVDLKDRTVSYNADDVVEVTFEERGADLGNHNYVDLGLKSGLMWATCNIGAEKPEECGNLYAWGYVEPLNSYIDWPDYKFFRAHEEWGDRFFLTKYTLSDDAAYTGIADNLSQLLPEDDAAIVNWGKGWRMPTKDDYDEIISKCSWEWVEDYKGTGVNGLVGISEVNGNTIFFPYVAPFTPYSVFHLYWSSSHVGAHPASKNAYGVGVKGEKFDQLYGIDANLYSAGSVRAVVKSNPPQTYMIVHFKKECSDEEGTDKFLMDDVVNVRFELDKELNYPVSGKVDGYEYVDLDLPSGTKWATMNIGANQPDGSGHYYSWGEVGTKEVYSKSEFSLSGDYYKLQNNGVLDLNGKLSASYDAANQNWSENWRMPTIDEFDELIENCNWKWTTFNGVVGYKVISKENCKWIFLPASNGQTDKGSVSSDVKGFYWTSQMPQRSTTVDKASFSLVFDEEEKYLHSNYNSSYYGLTVRPVVGNASVTIAKTFSVKFLDMDGDIIESQKVDEGNSAVAPEVPVVCGYKFKGWDKSFENVKSDLIVNAVYDELDVEVVDGHEFVDLGLPSGTKWAKYNIGATKSDILGEAYSWGYGTKGNNIFDLEDKGGLDSNGDLIPSYDIATQLWGENCKMPTKADFEELLAYCDWEWTTMYGEKGYKVSSKSSASDGCNCIFFPTPYTGYGLIGEENYDYLGGYWSSSSVNYEIYGLAALIEVVRVAPAIHGEILLVRPILKQK